MYRSFRRFARKARHHLRSLPTYFHWKRALRPDPLFDLAMIDRGLQPRPAPSSRTPEQRATTAQRIIDAYRRAKIDQAGQRPVYKVSNEWIPIFQEPLLPLLAILERGDGVALRDLLDNFFRARISQGLIGLGVNMAETFFEKTPNRFMRTQLLIDSVYRYRHLQSLLPKTSPADLAVEDFGNPYGMYVDGQFVRNGVDYQYFYAHKVTGLLPTTPKRRVVAELGGGIGGFSYFLTRANPEAFTYINLDLPEILAISSYQLLNLFPEKRVLLYGERAVVDSQVIAGYDLALMPSFVIEKLADDSVDVSFNSYSLAEMDFDTIQNYAKHMSRISAHAIFHVNHVAHSLVGGDNFYFDAEKFELVDRTRALWNMGRNLDCDEYEFLLKRRTA